MAVRRSGILSGSGLSAVAFGALFLALLFYIWSRYHTMRLGYELGRVSNQERALTKEQRSLKTEINNLSTSERIEKIARDHLKMEEAKPDQVVFIKPKADVSEEKK